jgi:hypothetical protein
MEKSRFISYSLGHENLSPLEGRLRAEFMSCENKKAVFVSVQTRVSPTIGFGAVVDAMHDTFLKSLSRSPTGVDELNRYLIERVVDQHARSIENSAKSREFGFVRGKIPSSMLPRPSFSLPEDDLN